MTLVGVAAAVEAESRSAALPPWGVREEPVLPDMLRKGQNLQETG